MLMKPAEERAPEWSRTPQSSSTGGCPAMTATAHEPSGLAPICAAQRATCVARQSKSSGLVPESFGKLVWRESALARVWFWVKKR